MKSCMQPRREIATCKPSTVQTQTHPLLRLYYDGVFIFFRHKNTGRKGWLQHIDNQVIGKDIQLLHLVPCHIGWASNAIPRGEKKTTENKPRPPEPHWGKAWADLKKKTSMPGWPCLEGLAERAETFQRPRFGPEITYFWSDSSFPIIVVTLLNLLKQSLLLSHEQSTTLFSHCVFITVSMIYT